MDKKEKDIFERTAVRFLIILCLIGIPLGVLQSFHRSLENIDEASKMVSGILAAGIDNFDPGPMPEGYDASNHPVEKMIASGVSQGKIKRDHPFKVKINLEVDGIPYELTRISWCWVEPRHPTSDKFPEFRVFGSNLPTGEAVVITIPHVCDFPKEACREGRAGQCYKPLPDTYLPLIALVDNATNPKIMTVYASRQAYESSAARIIFKDVDIDLLTHEEGQNYNRPDQFSLLGEPYKQLAGKENVQIAWVGRALERIGPNQWAKSERVSEVLKEAKEYSELTGADLHSVKLFVKNDHFQHLLQRGYGVPPLKKMRGTFYKPSPADSYVPYEYVDGAFKLRPDMQGMFILYSPGEWERLTRIREVEMPHETPEGESVEIDPESYVSATYSHLPDKELYVFRRVEMHSFRLGVMRH